MKKEKQLPLSQNPDAVKKLESLKFLFRDRENALESSDSVAYEWLEDSVIRKMASVDFGKDETGKDTATIKMVNPKTEKEEVVYHTADETEVASLKRISEGKTLVIEPVEKG